MTARAQPRAGQDDDTELEARIYIAYLQAVTWRTRDAWRRLAYLIKQRSPQRVARMEKERGLV